MDINPKLVVVDSDSGINVTGEWLGKIGFMEGGGRYAII